MLKAICFLEKNTSFVVFHEHNAEIMSRIYLNKIICQYFLSFIGNSKIASSLQLERNVRAWGQMLFVQIIVLVTLDQSWETNALALIQSAVVFQGSD